MLALAPSVAECRCVVFFIIIMRSATITKLLSTTRTVLPLLNGGIFSPRWQSMCVMCSDASEQLADVLEARLRELHVGLASA